MSYIQLMDYFASATSPIESIFHATDASIEATWEETESHSGETLALLAARGTDVAKERRKRGEARQRAAERERERQQSLAQVARRATHDAATAWDRGDAVFAPVLFQTLMRVEMGWEAALSEISQLGWRLDSWQVIGPAPDPFSYTVVMIQTLFKR